ncbi:MAG: hypothetical protein F6K63_29900 [Moorea sp. SIO1G6]|uniref:hypothetical protein n=1 Tax=Moorena sp. SIO1G6 TaxID=2607840 RepID=UPI0013BFA774|nr:hypothetical protein [Moorena sp. SIO1G6]NET68384.1 hypothetical protein [Moorena sp. SIO1G6]
MSYSTEALLKVVKQGDDIHYVRLENTNQIFESMDEAMEFLIEDTQNAYLRILGLEKQSWANRFNWECAELIESTLAAVYYDPLYCVYWGGAHDPTTRNGVSDIYRFFEIENRYSNSAHLRQYAGCFLTPDGAYKAVGQLFCISEEELEGIALVYRSFRARKSSIIEVLTVDANVALGVIPTDDGNDIQYYLFLTGISDEACWHYKSLFYPQVVKTLAAAQMYQAMIADNIEQVLNKTRADSFHYREEWVRAQEWLRHEEWQGELVIYFDPYHDVYWVGESWSDDIDHYSGCYLTIDEAVRVFKHWKEEMLTTA